MKIIRFNKISAKINNSIHILTYELLADTVPGRESYGIIIMDQTTGGVEMLLDLTSLEYRAEEFYYKLIQGRATPMSLKELAEDFLAE